MTRLAQDFHIELGIEVVQLRPTLREALRLEAHPGSFSGLLTDIQGGSLSAAVAIIKPHYSPRHLPALVYDHINELQDTLYTYVLALTGIDPDKKPTEASAGKQISIREHLEQLFKLGTGWLGWTPEETLESTPTEIRLAYEGRLDMLKALFGTSDKDDKALPDGATLDAQLKSAMTGFKSTKYASKQKRKRAA